MEQVQTVTVLENSGHLKNDVLKNFIGMKKRIVDQDCNNNESVGTKIVEHDPLLEDPQESSLFGFTFKAKIKWRNTIAIGSLHIAYAVCGLIYLWNRSLSMSSLWGEYIQRN